jgi:hypothetical protein
MQEPSNMNYEEVAPYLMDKDVEFYEEED